MANQPRLRPALLSVYVEEAIGRDQQGTSVWGNLDFSGVVKVEVRGADYVSQAVTRAASPVGAAVVWKQTLRLPLHAGADELRLLLCKVREAGGKRTGTVIAACGIPLAALLQRLPVNKLFNLFKPDGTGELGLIRLGLDNDRAGASSSIGRLMLHIHSAAGKSAEGQRMWPDYFSRFWLQVQLRSESWTTTAETSKLEPVGTNVAWQQQLCLELPEDTGELRIMLLTETLVGTELHPTVVASRGWPAGWLSGWASSQLALPMAGELQLLRPGSQDCATILSLTVRLQSPADPATKATTSPELSQLELLADRLGIV